MRALVVAVVMLVGCSALADEASEVRRLAAEISANASSSSEESLSRARRLLEAALEMLESESDNQCVREGLSAYSETFQPHTALEKAIAECR